MSNEQHGPARRLVDAALSAGELGNEEWARRIQSEADALDACPLRIIRSEQEYEAALARVEQLMDSAPGTRGEDELFIRAALVEQWEKEHYPIELPVLWPRGPQAAEQLARAMHEQYRIGLFGIPAWEGMGVLQRSRIVTAAAVLAKLHAESEAHDGD